MLGITPSHHPGLFTVPHGVPGPFAVGRKQKLEVEGEEAQRLQLAAAAEDRCGNQSLEQESGGCEFNLHRLLLGQPVNNCCLFLKINNPI